MRSLKMILNAKSFWTWIFIFCGISAGVLPGSSWAVEVPEIPTGLNVPSSDTDGAYGVSWNSSDGATSYRLVERKGSGSWSQIYSGSGTGKFVTGKTDGTYSYRVKACNRFSICSNWSASRSVTVVLPPPVPTWNAVPSIDYNGAYTVSWNSSPGATSYRLQERFNSGSWTQIHSGSATSKARSGRSLGSWTYRVQACLGSNCSGWSSIRTVNVPPPTPTGLNGPTTDYNGQYVISWNAAAGATSYRLQERLGSGSWVQIHSGIATHKIVSGNSPGTYHYRVRACSPSACSSWSSSMSVVVPPPPPAPGGLTGPTTDYNGSYTISWNSSSGALTYRLQERVGSGTWSQIYSDIGTSEGISGKSAGSYSYRVNACNGESICGSWSATHTVNVPAPPATPTGLTGPTESPSGNYTISWDASTGSSSYRLEERQGGGAWSQIHSGSSRSKGVSGKSTGSYTYRVKGCNAGSVCSGWSSTHTVEVPPSQEPPAAPPSPAPLNDPGQASAGETDTIGSTAGSFRVDESGGATYSIPIATAAGTAGVEPQISLNYSSSAGNNIAGNGWSVGGLSSISRCRQTFDQDRNVSRLSFTSSDRYCLDGTRLLLTSTHNYGDAGSGYRLEIDDGAIVTAVGSVSGEPDYFEVKRKDGSISYYGKAPGNSDLSAKLGDGPGRTLTWAIRQFKDSVGNSIWFEYDGSNGSQRISKVKWAYGGNTDPVSGFGAMLEFIYESRLDRKSVYVDGALFQNDQRLRTIISYNNVNQEIRRYKLRYNEGVTATTDNISRLTSIEECVGTTCLPKTTFDWLLPAVSPSWSTIDSFSMGSDVVQYQSADINGDGRMDLVWVQGSYLKYALYTGSGYTITPFSNGSTSLALGSFMGEKIKVFDYNLDGRQDVALHEKGPDRWNVVLSKPHGGGSWRLSAAMIPTNTTGAAAFIDVDSNGTTDALTGDFNGDLYLQRLELDPSQADTSARRYAYGAGIPIAGMAAACFGAIQPGAPDFNGDGQVDAAIIVAAEPCQYPWFIGPITAVTFAGFTGTAPAITEYHAFPAPQEFQSPDVNSDGLSDAFYPFFLGPAGDREFRLDINRGDGTFTTVDVLTDSVTDLDTHPQFADWNMDGYPDLLWKDNTGSGSLRIRYWNPDTGHLGPASIVTTTVSSSDLESISIFDANGDAVPDLVRINADGTPGSVIVSTRKQGSIAAFVGVNRINSITNGLGATTEIEYEPLSYSNHYERLEYTTSPGTAKVCGAEFGGTFCWDEPIQVPNVGEFYEEINGDWNYPSTWQHLKKSSPIIEMSGPLYVVTSVESDAPAAGGSPGIVDTNATSSISYYYGEAKIQAAGRGFLGFQRLTTIDDQSGVKTTTRYRQDWPFIGRPISTIVSSSAGHLLSTSLTEWSVVEWDAATEETAADFGTAALGPLHVVQKKHEETTYDLVFNGAAAGGKVSSVTTDSEFDTEGNVTRITVTTRNGQGAIVKTVETRNVYDVASFQRWEGRLASTEVETGNTTRRSTFTYYPSGAHRGLLWTETIEPNTSIALMTEHSYDAHGNPVKSKQIGGSEVRCDAVTSTFDTRYRYVDVTRDCLGRTMSAVTSRNKYGAPASIETYVDAATSFTTHISYSALGREYYRYKEDGSSQTSYLTSTTINCPAGTAFKALKAASGGSESQECFDVLGRVTRTLTRGFNGQWNAQDTEYDAFGRVQRKSEPYDLGVGAQYWTTFQYDLLGRVTRTDLPDGSWGTTTYSGLTTVKTAHTNVGSQSRTEVRNAASELVQVIDNLGGSTSYGYDDQGNLTRITDNAGNVSVMQYDLRGRKILTNDPDMGLWEYDYNAFGDLTFQKNANGQTRAMTYDGLGRITARVDRLSETGPVESNTVWEYDTAAYGLGQLASVQDTESGFMRALLYDSLGRVSEVITNFGGGIYYEMTTYDQFGRVYQAFDAAGDGSYTSDGIVNGYNAYGYLASVGDAVRYGTEPRVIYRRIVAMNARGQVTVEERGIDNVTGGPPAVTTTYAYWPASGRLRSVSGVNPTGFDVQDLDYTWDQLGNLTQRQDHSGSKALTETFAYDGLNRLTQATVAGQGSVTITYDSQHLGNIVAKSDVGSYAYTSSRPHAVTSAGGATYTYDANGNNLTGDGRVLKYTTFDKPYEITKGSHKTTFAYGPDRARYLRVDQGTGGTTTTRYIGSVEIIDRPDGTQERKRYIAGVAIETRTVTGGVEGGRTTLYVHKDHLGSLDVITDAAGTVVQELSFDAWGQRRDATNWQALSAGALIGFDHSLTTRGFTGHEMLDEVGLIHMNGRVYDPKLARFLQADPVIQDPLNAQSLNRYSYVWNNPLNATDPSGYFVFSLAAMFLVAADVVTKLHAIMAVFAAAGFADTLIAGGSFKDALLAGISSAAFAGLGVKLGSFSFGFNVETIGRVAAFGTLGGVTSVLQGGKFGHGFRSAGLSAFVGGIAGRVSTGLRLGRFGQAIARMVAAGTTSELTGGKFANGAAYAAFSAVVSMAGNEIQQRRLAATQRVGEVYSHGVGGVFKHASVRFYPDDPEAIDAYLAEAGFEERVRQDDAGRSYITFSGGPDREGLGLGSLRGEINRPSDLAANRNVLVGDVYAPAGFSEDAFIKQLIQNTAAYNLNQVNYDLFPTLSSGFNSNSYVNGLVISTGGLLDVDFNWRYEGFNEPVPAARF